MFVTKWTCARGRRERVNEPNKLIVMLVSGKLKKQKQQKLIEK